MRAAILVGGLILVAGSGCAGDEGIPSSVGFTTTSQIALIESQEEPLYEADGSSYRYIVVRDSISHRLPELREAHPESTILLYKNVGFTLDDPSCEYDPLQGGGLSECQTTGHEGWFLHATDGSRLRSAYYDGQNAMDLSSDAYRRAWLDAVADRLSDARNDGSAIRFDGVWMDDTNLYPGHGMDGRIAELDDRAYGRAAMGFVREVGGSLRDLDFEVVLNLGMQVDDEHQRQWAEALARRVNVINREGFVRYGESGPALTSTPAEVPFWDLELELAESIQAAGARLHAITYGSASDEALQAYARATFLLAWDGQDGSALNYRTVDGDAWAGPWIEDLGQPEGSRRAIGVGWMRSFDQGAVVVNPSPTEVQAFWLDVPMAPSTGGFCADRFRLEPVSALILRPC